MSDPKTKITRRKALLALMCGTGVAACSRTMLEKAFDPWPPLELILCAADEVFVLLLGGEEKSSQVANLRHDKVWSWRAADSPEIPESLKRAFRSTDDCKPIDDGRKILISSSSGAVALVERESKRALFHAPVVNAHSIEMLPGGYVAAAASVSDSAAGNRIILFDLATGKEIASDALYSAHGVVWDEKREMLWALGGSELRGYRMASNAVARPPGRDKSPTEVGATYGVLKCELQTKLPEEGGHDLSPIPGTSLLFVSTNRHCWYFDRDRREFKPHDVLGDAQSIKSYSVHRSGRIAYVQAEGGTSFSERVRLLHPAGLLHLPGQRLYKARWR